jgi:hypothetical protein
MKFKYTIQIQSGSDGSWQEISGFFLSEDSAKAYIEKNFDRLINAGIPVSVCKEPISL